MKSLLHPVVVFGILLGVLPGFAQTFTFGPTSASVGANAGSGTVGLTVDPSNAPWNASSNVGWLTVSPSSGTGSAILTYSVSSNANTVEPRNGAISVGSNSFLVKQSGANVLLTPANLTVGPLAGTSMVGLTVAQNVTWTASSNAAWLTVSPTSGTGSATLTVSYSNTTSTGDRSATVAVGEQTLAVVQDKAILSFVPSNTLVGPSGGVGSLELTVVPASASWTASSDQNWLEVTPISGVGNAQLTYSYTSNPSSIGRLATIVAGGRAFGVSQSGRVASFSPAKIVVAPSQGSGSVQLTVDPPDTAWDLTTFSNGNWLSAAPTSGVGNATITFNYSLNLQVRSRLATISAAGRRFAVTQRGAGGAYTPWGTTAFGQIVTVVGESWPVGMTYEVGVDPAGNVFVPTNNTLTVFRVDASTGVVSPAVGNGNFQPRIDGVLATQSSIVRPTDLSINQIGDIYVAETPEYVRRVDGATQLISTFAGSGGGFAGDGGLATAALFNDIQKVHIDNIGNVYILDRGNHRVRRVDAVTKVITTVVGNGDEGFATDGTIATQGASTAIDITSDEKGNLYLSEYSYKRIRRVDPTTGTLTTFAGGGVPGSYLDGSLATLTDLGSVLAIAFDEEGNLYAAGDNNTVRRVNRETGKIHTIVGGGEGFGGDSGAAVYAQLNYPRGIATDSAGNLYIADHLNHRIRFIDFTTPKETLSITANNATRPYGAPAPQFSGTIGLTHGGDVITATYTTDATPSSPVGAYAIVPWPQGLTVQNYETVLTNGVLQVTPAPLTVMANSFVRNFGAPNPVFTGTLGSTQNGDVIGVVYSTTAAATSLPGTYPIVPVLSGAALPNYSVNATNGTLTINDIVLSVSRPKRPARDTTGNANVQTLTLEVHGLAPGQAASVAVQCSLPSLICQAQTQIVADAAGTSSFDVTVRAARSLRLRRHASGMLRVVLQFPGLHKETTIPLSF